MVTWGVPGAAPARTRGHRCHTGFTLPSSALRLCCLGNRGGLGLVQWCRGEGWCLRSFPRSPPTPPARGWSVCNHPAVPELQKLAAWALISAGEEPRGQARPQGLIYGAAAGCPEPVPHAWWFCSGAGAGDNLSNICVQSINGKIQSRAQHFFNTPQPRYAKPSASWHWLVQQAGKGDLRWEVEAEVLAGSYRARGWTPG